MMFVIWSCGIVCINDRQAVPCAFSNLCERIGSDLFRSHFVGHVISALTWKPPDYVSHRCVSGESQDDRQLVVCHSIQSVPLYVHTCVRACFETPNRTACVQVQYVWYRSLVARTDPHYSVFICHDRFQ